MAERTIHLPSTVEIKYGWVTFPKFAKPIKEDGTSLWPERWPLEALAERRIQMGPIAWAQEMENNPIPEENSYFTLDKFESCYDYDCEFEWEYRGNNPVFIGVDSQANPDPKKAGDFGCVFVLEFFLDTEDRRILWIERGRWGFRVTNVIREMESRYRPAKIVVENNAAQDYIVQEVSSNTAIPVEGFTTGSNKPDLYIGIPYLAATVSNRKWIIPRGGPKELEMTDQWVKECLEYGQGHTGDVAMASWFANEGARQVSSLYFNNIPSIDNASYGTPDFTRERNGMEDMAHRNLISPVMIKKVEDLGAERVKFNPRSFGRTTWRSPGRGPNLPQRRRF